MSESVQLNATANAFGAYRTLCDAAYRRRTKRNKVSEAIDLERVCRLDSRSLVLSSWVLPDPPVEM